MSIESMAMSAVAAIGRRPRVSNALFGHTKWGNPFGDERFSWPYPMYDRMRESGAVSFGRAYNQWFVLGYDEVRQVLASSDTSSAAVVRILLGTPQFKKLTPQARTNFSRWLLGNDAPDHPRLRSAVSRAFTPKQIAAYAPLVEKVTADLLAELPTSGEIDIVDAFTDRLPIQVISELLGLPSEKRAWLHEASREIAGMIEPLTPFDPDSMSQRFAELDEYFTELVLERRARPTGDLISALAANNDGEALDPDEVVAMIAVLLTAGHETVTGMLGNSLFVLSKHTDQRQLLRSSPDLIDNAIEELLRFDPSAQVTGRQATATITIGDKTIKKGQNIGLMVAAANRDPRQWDDPNTLRLDRPNPSPISFGFGAHHCLGAALARMQLRNALPPLLDHLGDYTIDPSTITWKRSFSLRGPTSMPLVMG